MSNFLSLIEEDDSIESVQLIVCRRGALDAIVIAIKNFILDTTIVSAGRLFRRRLTAVKRPVGTRIDLVANVCFLLPLLCRCSR